MEIRPVRDADRPAPAMQLDAVVQTDTAAVRLWRDLGFELVGTVPGPSTRAATAAWGRT